MSSLAVAVVFDPPALGGHIEPLLEVVVRSLLSTPVRTANQSRPRRTAAVPGAAA
jgi:hypothetical protein